MHDGEGQREAARSSLRGFIDKITVPSDDRQPLMVFGDLGRMLTAAVGERDGSALVLLVGFGCGGAYDVTRILSHYEEAGVLVLVGPGPFTR